jgi:phosphate-selective porin OprO/OprP
MRGSGIRTLAGLTAGWAAAHAQPADRAEVEALRAQVQRLEAQVGELLRRLEATERPATAEKRQPPAGAPSNEGEAAMRRSDGARAGRGPTTVAPVAAKSPESPRDVKSPESGVVAESFPTVRLKGLVNVDARSFGSGDGGPGGDTLVLRRARLIAEGSAARATTFQLTTEFAGSTATVLDANATVAWHDAVQVRFGRFKTPIGYEVLQGAAATHFAERSLLSGLLPNRDVGVQLGGRGAGGRLEYAAGVFNGTVDGTHADYRDADDRRQLAGRLVLRPGGGWAMGVGAGGGTDRTERTAVYRTEGQRSYFMYRPGTRTDGGSRRVSPFLEYRSGPFGLLGEAAWSRTTVRAAAGGAAGQLEHRGWQATAGWMVTGEEWVYGPIAPRHEFDPAGGRWGAWELVGRVAETRFDPAAFPRWASPEASARRAGSAGLGVKWYWSRAAVLGVNWVRTDFAVARAEPFAVPAALLRQGERLWVSRFQLTF